MMRHELLRKRFGQKVQLTFHCQIITPMFLGDAFQDAALRPEPFKSLLRYWWRVAVGRKVSDHQTLLEEETLLFGGGGEKAQKSLVVVQVEGEPQIITSQNLPKVDDVRHPEVNRPVNPLLYLGYGPIIWQRGIGSIYNRFYFTPGREFQLKISFSKSLWEDEDFKTAIKYFCAFGAVGFRSRNGWGSFQVDNSSSSEPDFLMSDITKIEESHPFWEKCFERLYPYSLARDQKGLLLWKEEGFESWEKAMKFLAEVYIYIRTGKPQKNQKWKTQPKLDPDGEDCVDERHLLGFPLGEKHVAKKHGWSKFNKKKNRYVPSARLASPLRFFVRKKNNSYRAFILHLPYYLDHRIYCKKSNCKNEPGCWPSKNKQIETWKKVHQRLDEAMQRASINECL